MHAQLIALLIMMPVTAVFVYAGIHEYKRFKSDGRAQYGLVYDEETGTSHVTGISEDEAAYDPEDYDPNDYKSPEARTEAESGTDDEKTS